MNDQNDQSFIDNIIQTVKDNGEYFVPIKGTKKSWDDYQQSKDPMDLIATIASGIGDVALIGGPVAGVFKGIGYGTRAANLASKAGKLGKVAKTWDESAKAAKSAGNIKKASRLQRGSAEAAHRSKLLTEDAQLARGARNSHFRSLPLYGITYYDSRLPAQGSKRLKSMNKVEKVTPSNGDLVKKRTKPFLYNNFQKKDGGSISLIPKHQYGNSVSMQNPEESVKLRFGQEYFTFPSTTLNEQQREFINKYNDKKYRGMFVSDEDEYNFYKAWEQNFGPYEPSNSTYGGYYTDDSGNIKRANYDNGQWSVDTTKYKVYTTPLNYSKDNGYYFKVGNNTYKGGRYR